MKDRNPSRAGKSERQKQALARHIKGIVSDDTSQVDSPFEPSNVAAGAKLPIANSGTRPEGWGRKIEKHLRNNTATYLSVIATIVVGLIITPIFNMNREIGEVRTEYKEMKKNIDDIKANSQD